MKTNMENTTQLIKRENSAISAALTPQELVQQVNLIQQVMRSVMKDKEHYGTIPGCGDKKTLLKSGAEKISFTFRLAPSYTKEVIDLGNGHREYSVTCTLKHISSDQVWGQGLGSCSTQESKYRYRSDATGKPVPSEYWNNRDSSLLGGSDYQAKKTQGKWLIYKRVEHDNPADYYNTCLKMAKKRAHVDAVLTATAASDLFTQDVEDIAENNRANAGDPIDVESEVLHGDQQQTQQQPSQTNATRSTTASGDWRQHRIHFGKNKDKALGELDPGALSWYQNKWEPKEYNGKYSEADLELRKALNASMSDGNEIDENDNVPM